MLRERERKQPKKLKLFWKHSILARSRQIDKTTQVIINIITLRRYGGKYLGETSRRDGKQRDVRAGESRRLPESDLDSAATAAT